METRAGDDGAVVNVAANWVLLNERAEFGGYGDGGAVGFCFTQETGAGVRVGGEGIDRQRCYRREENGGRGVGKVAGR